MRDLAILILHLTTTVMRLLRPGGTRSVIAESLMVTQQLLIINRSRHRGPYLRTMDRVIAGLCAQLIHPHRPTALPTDLDLDIDAEDPLQALGLRDRRFAP